MTRLNRSFLNSDFCFPEDLAAAKGLENLPEKVLQFGEGNFLRAFVDWMIHQLNKQGKFNGRVVAVQPIPEGLIDVLNEQDGLYTLLLRGLEDGKPVEKKEIISSVSRGINPYRDWQAYLACAENPDIEYIVSNTTEAGIIFDKNDRPDMQPPQSFPGKLTVYLQHRFAFFKGDSSKGMVIIPCELIDRNGDKLKDAVLKLADEWQLPEAFKNWIRNHNYFLNSLVDRVVTGYPRDEVQAIEAKLGYQDKLMNAGELFHLWVIEGPAELAKRLPFAEAGLNVIWTNNMTPYRTRKVRILNGAHTASVPAAFLYGLDAVKEMMDHEVMGKYVRDIVSQEIIPSIDLEKQMLVEFADAVIERFRNPFIKHYLLSILLNSSSKFTARVLPSILEYQKHTGKLPEKLTFSLAALLAVYKDGKLDGTSMVGTRAAGDFIMKDDVPVLEFFAREWQACNGRQDGVFALTRAALANEAIWGQDLNRIDGLTEKTAGYLFRIISTGMQETVRQLVGGKA